MHLGSDMVRDEAHDAFAIVWRQTFAGIDQTTRQPIDPETTVWIEHDFNDRGIFEEERYGWTKCGAQHARATRSRLLVEMVDCHLCPQRGDRGLRS